MKFGGASVAFPKRFLNVADIIISRKKEYDDIVVVVSAMGKTTDRLLKLAKMVHDNPPKREQDMLISVGERISIALLSMALAKKGGEAISFTGSQSGIITCERHSEARIIDVRPKRIIDELMSGRVVIVAGFQGVSKKGEITTLGRGGSDTSAVALGIALNAEKVEFYKDVPGIYSEDPKINSQASFFSELSYEEALDIMYCGCKVLSSRCIRLAMDNQLPLQVRSFVNLENEGTIVRGKKIEKDLLQKEKLVVYESF